MGFTAWHANRMTTPTTAFGERLRYYRETAGLTQMALAARVNRETSHISRLEAGNRTPSSGTAIDLADALDLTGAQRIAFLALAGFLEHPLTDAQASYLSRAD